MNVQPSAAFEAVIDTGTTGLAGTIGVEANDNTGSTAIGFTTTGIVEIAPGVYAAAALTAPSSLGQYTLIWRDGAGGTVLGVEDLLVTTTATAPVGGGETPVGGTTGMSGTALITEFLADRRFGQTRSRVLGFLNYRYGELLGLEEWAFLEGKTAVTLNAATVDAPAGMGLPWRMWLNDDGDPLDFLDLTDFQDRYLGAADSGRPAAFAVYSTSLLIGPTPDGSYPATLHHQLQPAQLADTDTSFPVTPADTHLALVAGAQAFALELENDPTGQPLEARYQRTIDAMRRRYLTTGRGMATQMPRDPVLR